MYSIYPYLGLVIFVVLIFFCLRKRRKNKFGGDSESAHVKGGGGASGTALEEGGDNEVKEDGMGGRLSAGLEGVGIITPYSFQPAPIGRTTASGRQPQHQPQIREISNTAFAADGVGAGLAAVHPNGKRARQRIHALHTSNPSSSIPNEQDPFVLNLSSVAGNANETETMGEDIFNPYLLTEPEPPSRQHQQHHSTTSPTAVPSQPPRAGTAVVVHDRVVLRSKGDSEEGEGERDSEMLSSESPPTYDSLPLGVRRDG